MTNKYLLTDPRSINDIASASSETKAFHDNKAAAEASRILSQYKSSPVFAKLLAMHLAGQADVAYSDRMKNLEASRPENQRDAQLKREITQQVYKDLGLTEDGSF